MSKEVEWSDIHGEGTICCECDNCGETYDYDFEDSYPDFRDCQDELSCSGWVSRKVDGEWCDFCCKECYNEYIKNNKTGWR